MEKANIKLMVWYKRIGRFLYGAFFVLALIITVVQIVERMSNIYISIIFDITWVMVGVVLEANLIQYRELGTIYVDTNTREDRFELIEYNTNDDIYFVSESKDDYVVKLSGVTYFKSFRKSEVTIEENPNIERPFAEIITTEKVSKPASNEYSIFSLTGDKIKIEKFKIIVRNKDKDIRNN